MRILFVGPPLYGLLYPVLSPAQAFRVNGHEVLIASGGQFAQKAAEAGLVVFDAAPGLDSEAGYRHHEAQRKKVTSEPKWATSHSSAKKWQTIWWSLPDTGGLTSSSTLHSESSGR